MEIEFEVGFSNLIKFENYLYEEEKTIDEESKKITKAYDDNINQIFVGFKDAFEIISDCKFFCDGKLIKDYNQNEFIRENYAFNCHRPKNVKKGFSHAHSLWEDVQNMNPNVTGVYIPISNLVSDKESDKQKFVKIRMELIIPFTDQMSIQSWRLYPNSIAGEIVEEVRTSLDSLVWCQIQPKNVVNNLSKKKGIQAFFFIIYRLQIILSKLEKKVLL